MAKDSGWNDKLIHWYETVKRDLPWRHTQNPYHIWISEIMLQQTRVEAVIAYYNRFLQLFPTIETLAEAPQDTVLKAWEGLGYYSRARNIHKAAQVISTTLSGKFPAAYDELLKLPGIGEYTAGAIASIAYGLPVPAIDGNVKRVFSRFKGIRENVNQPSVLRAMRRQLTDAIPKNKASVFNQALMELGATICIPRTPRCANCPLRNDCDACAAGDAEQLPVMDRKKPPQEVAVAVCLLTFKGSILVFQRKERLLQGLYVFGLIENTDTSQEAQHIWAERGLQMRFMADMGDAKHIFTHRIWNMNVFHFELTQKPNNAFLQEYNAQLVELAQLESAAPSHRYESGESSSACNIESGNLMPYAPRYALRTFSSSKRSFALPDIEIFPFSST